jgi:chromosomal replication initiator protein
MKVLWEDIKSQLKTELPKSTYSLWVEPLTFQQLNDAKFVIGCPNKFARSWIAENYLTVITEKLKAAGAASFDLTLEVQSTPKPGCLSKSEDPPPLQLPLPNFSISSGGRLMLHRDFTFDQFVVGKSNEFAYSATRAFAQGSPASYHTLFMLANTGLGKTHLSHAAGHLILQNQPDIRVYYITAEDFTNEMISSLRNNRIEHFKEKYRRACDVLLLEEVHFLSGKEKTQSELAYTLDALANDNKKIMFTSSLAPREIPSISKELSSRLTAGLVATIEKPDKATRADILHRKAARLQLSLSEEIVELIATKLEGDIRKLESALKCLKARADLLGENVDLDLAKDVLKCLAPETRSTTTEEIQDIVCNYFKLEPDHLRSRSRKKVYSLPRNIYVYLCRRHTAESVETIAKTIERSHSAVIYATELIAHKMKADRRLKQQIAFLTQKIRTPEP